VDDFHKNFDCHLTRRRRWVIFFYFVLLIFILIIRYLKQNDANDYGGVREDDERRHFDSHLTSWRWGTFFPLCALKFILIIRHLQRSHGFFFFFSLSFSGLLNHCLQLDYVYGTMITTMNGYLQTPLIGSPRCICISSHGYVFSLLFFWFTKWLLKSRLHLRNYNDNDERPPPYTQTPFTKGSRCISSHGYFLFIFHFFLVY
jgi:hypothetical protein